MDLESAGSMQSDMQIEVEQCPPLNYLRIESKGEIDGAELNGIFRKVGNGRVPFKEAGGIVERSYWNNCVNAIAEFVAILSVIHALLDGTVLCLVRDQLPDASNISSRFEGTRYREKGMI